MCVFVQIRAGPCARVYLCLYLCFSTKLTLCIYQPCTDPIAQSLHWTSFCPFLESQDTFSLAQHLRRASTSSVCRRSEEANCNCCQVCCRRLLSPASFLFEVSQTFMIISAILKEKQCYFVAKGSAQWPLSRPERTCVAPAFPFWCG